MEPTLAHTCWVLVDRDRRQRCQLLSDHPGWDPAPWPEGAEVFGEVKWTARMFL